MSGFSSAGYPRGITNDYNTIGQNFANYGTKNADGVGGNPMFSYFGAPNSGVDRDLLASDNARYTNYQEWKAYDRQPVAVIKEIITLAIVNANTFYTSETDGLPVRFTDQRRFVLHEYIFDQAFAHREPTESVARVVRSGQRERSYQVQRRGLQIEVEHGFFHTPQGRKHFILSVQNVISSINKTIQYDIVTTLLKCRERTKEWEKRFGILNKPKHELAHIVAKEAFVLNKSKRGAAHVCWKNKNIFKHRGKGNPTCLWTGPNTEPYFVGVGAEDTEFMKAGNGAYARRHSDIYNINNFCGLRIHTTDIFNPYAGQAPIDPLVRLRTFGNYVMMHPQNGVRGPGHRDVYINDWGRDKNVRIVFEDAVQNAINFDVFAANYAGPAAAPGPAGAAYGKMDVSTNMNDHVSSVSGAMAKEMISTGSDNLFHVSELVEQSEFDEQGAHENNINVLSQLPAENQLVEKYSAAHKTLNDTAKAGLISNIAGLLDENNVEEASSIINGLSGSKKKVAGLINKLESSAPKTKTVELEPKWTKAEDIKNIGINNFNFDNKVKTISAKMFNISVDEENEEDEVNEAGAGVAAGAGGAGIDLLSAVKQDNEGKADSGVSVILLRPFQECKTTSAIIMKGGESTGFVAVGNRDAQTGTDTMAKRHHVHFTFNSKAMVSDPDNVVVQDDILMQEYVAGRGSTFYSKDDLDTLSREGWITEDDPNRPSIIAILFDHRSISNFENIPLEIPEVLDLAEGEYLSLLKELYPNFASISQTNLLGDEDDLVNTVCYRDFCIRMGEEGKFNKYEVNTGHLGPNIYPGMRRDAESGTETWRECEYVRQ